MKARISSGDSLGLVISNAVQQDNMGTEPINRLYGRKSLTTLLVTLAMLVVVTAGTASAETANTQALENGKETLEVIKQVEADYALSEILLSDAESQSYNFTLADAEDMDQNGSNVVVLVWTNGEVAWVVVVVIHDDGTYDINKVGRMSVEALRERLANFDGRVIVNYIGDSNDDQCAHGTLAARWSLIDATENAGDGQFRGVWMDAQGYMGGDVIGLFANGHFRGEATNLDGEIIATFAGEYGRSTYYGEWQLIDGTANGVLAGKYRLNADGEGVMKGRWKADCSGPGVEPVPHGPQHIDCKNMTDAADARCKVKPMPKPMPLPIDDEVKPKPKPSDDGIENIKKDAEDLLETKLVETDGGISVDVGDAAAGGAISSIPMLGLSLLRRRFLL